MSAVIKEQEFPLFQVWKSLAKGYNMPKTAKNRANFDIYFVIKQIHLPRKHGSFTAI